MEKNNLKNVIYESYYFNSYSVHNNTNNLPQARQTRTSAPKDIFLDCHTKALLALQDFIDSGKEFQFRLGDTVNYLLWIEDQWCGINNINELRIWKVFYLFIFKVEKYSIFPFLHQNHIHVVANHSVEKFGHSNGFTKNVN